MSAALAGGPRTAGAPDAATVLVVALVGGAGLYGLAPDGPLGELAYVVVYGAATALAWVGVARHPAGDRAPWTLVAGAATVTLVGDLIKELLLPDATGATIADVPWIAAMALLLAGLLRMEPIRLRGRVDVDAVIDGSVALVVGLVVAWEVVLDGLVARPGASALDRVVAGTYPVLDVVLLAVVVRLLLRGDRSRPVLLASIGTLVLLVVDLAMATDPDRAAGTGLTLGWMAALLLLASSTLPATVRPSSEPSERLRLWLVLAPVGVPVGLLLRGQITHDHPNTGVTLATTAALLALAAIRSQRLLRAVEQARRAIEVRERRYRALTANAADAVCVTDADGVLVRGEESLARLLGATPADVAGVDVHDEELLVDPPAVQRLLVRAKDSPGVVHHQEIEVRRPDGTHRWLEVAVVSMLDDPIVAGVVANLRDVTDRRRDEDELRYRTFHDVATGLANRELLRDRVEHAMRRGARRGTDPAVLHLELDGIRPAVEGLGLDEEHLLRAVAERLRATARSEDTMARIGPHELAVLVEENHPDTAEATTTAERLVQALSRPFPVDGRDVELEVRIGLAVADADTTADGLLRNAATALAQARDEGGPAVVTYRSAMGAEATERAVLRGMVPQAVARHELELACDPVVRLSDDAVVGFEAQVRWQHPVLGLLPPDRFMPIAEESDAALAIGRWLLDAACAAAVARDHGLPASVGVDLSERHLLSDGVVDDVRRALERSGLHPALLVLEVTETAVVRGGACAVERLPALAELGVRIAIDDFGTGYSSLRLLRQLPVDLVKVDGSFVETIEDDEVRGGAEVPPIVRGLLELAATLELEVVAQGVARPAQADALRAAGCELAQGPLFATDGRPRPVVGPARNHPN